MSRKRRVASGEQENLSSLAARRSPLVAFVVMAMEAVLLILVCLSPWVYGAVHPGFEFLLDVGIAVLLALWAARMLLEGRITWKKSPVALCFAGLFVLGVWQQTPFPRSMLDRLSPNTARRYGQLLPAQPETLPNDMARSNSELLPGSTLSLYPGATRRETARLLAVFLVFAVVTNNLTSTGALVRLSGAVLINGVLLSLFALAQFFAAPHNTVYWTYPSLGQVFGPFINRNHFPDYVNLCIGLGIGLLVSQDCRASADQGHFPSSFASSEQTSSLLRILHNPLALWICAALGLMVSAVAFCRSRGGLLALVGAALICTVLGRLRLGRSFRLGAILLVGGMVVALSTWFGVGLVKDRLDTLWSGEAFDSRVPLWLRSLPIVKDFPIWGTGYGTFGYIEPMYRMDAPSRETLAWYDHAHSDYLEILVEGGAVGLGMAVLALTVVYRRGYRALVLNRGRAEAGLTLGALFAFTSLVLHSFGEFGAHIPAITLLATVVCAHLCALGRSNPHHAQSVGAVDSDEYCLRLGGLAPVIGAIAAVGLGLVLCGNGWKSHRLNLLENAAVRAGNADADQLRMRIAYLAAAVSLAPDDAPLHYELGFAHERLAELLNSGIFSDRRAAREQTVLALREYLQARDACPLLGGAQMGIAAYSSRLKQGDVASDYLRRAKLLTPGQPEMWYLCGLREIALGHPEDAWATWRHCLELSSNYLPQVLNRTRKLKTDQLLEKALPDNPDLLLVAALLRYPDAGAVEQRHPFMKKALSLLESDSERVRQRESHVNEQIHQARFEFARYLYERGKLEEARSELMLVLAKNPNYGPARDLLNAVMLKRR